MRGTVVIGGTMSSGTTPASANAAGVTHNGQCCGKSGALGASTGFPPASSVIDLVPCAEQIKTDCNGPAKAINPGCATGAPGLAINGRCKTSNMVWTNRLAAATQAPM